MPIWTYTRPFQYNNEMYEVKFSYTLSTYTSELYHADMLIDSCTHSFKGGFSVIEHMLQPANSDSTASVFVGYCSWWSVGIEVNENNELIYASHPGKDIRFAEKKIAKFDNWQPELDTQQQKQQHSEKWQQNKHSILADIALGIAFFIVAKVTGDLTIAALTGVSLGLALIVLQRFVKVDLLGGFAVFGTIMLLISGLFSLAFQSEYLVQLKGTIMGLLTATIFLIDGGLRKGRYFGPRFERFLSSPVEHQFFVIGLGVIGGVMAGINYLIATYLSEDMWLNYTTFMDTPLYFILFFTLMWQANKRLKQ